MDQKNLTFDYDQESDVFYCSFGVPVEAVGVEVEEGIVVRIDEQTHKVVGITVSDFNKRFGAQSQSLSVPVSVEAEALCAVG